jgi:hypothetical protein
VGIVLVYRFVPVPLTILMVQRCVEQKLDGKPMRLEKDWVSADEISYHLPMAVVASEDQRFLYHHGFDFEAIEKAVKHNEKQKEDCMKVYDLHNALGYGKVVIELLTLKQFIIEPKNEQLNDLFKTFGDIYRP